jgi:hypothetical protein
MQSIVTQANGAQMERKNQGPKIVRMVLRAPQIRNLEKRFQTLAD